MDRAPNSNLSFVAIFSVAGSLDMKQSIWSHFLSRRSDLPSQSSSTHSQVSLIGVDASSSPKWMKMNSNTPLF